MKTKKAGNRHTFKRQDIVQSIVKMRLEDGASSKTILKDFLQDQLGYKQSMAYTLYKEAREAIEDLYKESCFAKIEEAYGRLEALYEDSISKGERKLALDIQKEINKLSGFHSEKVDITSGGDKLGPTEIAITIVRPSE